MMKDISLLTLSASMKVKSNVFSSPASTSLVRLSAAGAMVSLILCSTPASFQNGFPMLVNSSLTSRACTIPSEQN